MTTKKWIWMMDYCKKNYEHTRRKTKAIKKASGKYKL